VEPRTQLVIAEFVRDHGHLERIPGVDDSEDFICIVCSSVGRYAVRWKDPIQSITLRMGRDCDRYVRSLMQANAAHALSEKLELEVERLLAV